jgi:hypothetical protein
MIDALCLTYLFNFAKYVFIIHNHGLVSMPFALGCISNIQLKISQYCQAQPEPQFNQVGEAVKIQINKHKFVQKVAKENVF